MKRARAGTTALAWLAFAITCYPAAKRPLQTADLARLRSVGEVALSPDGSRLAYTIVYRDGPGRPYARLWIMSVAEAGSIAIGSKEEPAGGPEWSPDGRWLAYEGRVGDKSGLAVVRPDGSGVRFLAPVESTNSRMPETGKRLAWSPDSQRLATASSDGTGKVWEAASGRELLRLEGHLNSVWAVAWSPDGQWLATGSGDGTAQLWEAASGRELLILRGHTNSVR